MLFGIQKQTLLKCFKKLQRRSRSTHFFFLLESSTFPAFPQATRYFGGLGTAGEGGETTTVTRPASSRHPRLCRCSCWDDPPVEHCKLWIDPIDKILLEMELSGACAFAAIQHGRCEPRPPTAAAGRLPRLIPQASGPTSHGRQGSHRGRRSRRPSLRWRRCRPHSIPQQGTLRRRAGRAVPWRHSVSHP